MLVAQQKNMERLGVEGRLRAVNALPALSQSHRGAGDDERERGSRQEHYLRYRFESRPDDEGRRPM